MSKARSRGRFPASRPIPARPKPKLARNSPEAQRQARQHELSTKRLGELAELAFSLKAYSLGFGVSKPYGDSERYDTIIDARQIIPEDHAPSSCHPELRRPIHKADRLAKLKASPEPAEGDTASAATSNAVDSNLHSAPSNPPGLRASVAKKKERRNVRGPRGAARASIPPQTDPTPPLWRVQVKCSTQLVDGMYRLNAARRLEGRAVPYQPGEIDFLAAYIVPEDTWYIVPLDAFLGLTALLFRRHDDPKPGHYDQYKEAWPLLRPKMHRCESCGADSPVRIPTGKGTTSSRADKAKPATPALSGENCNATVSPAVHRLRRYRRGYALAFGDAVIARDGALRRARRRAHRTGSERVNNPDRVQRL